MRQISELEDHVEEISQKKKEKNRAKKMPKDENHEGEWSVLETQEIYNGTSCT